jgi:hypothetical protein
VGHDNRAQGVRRRRALQLGRLDVFYNEKGKT